MLVPGVVYALWGRSAMANLKETMMTMKKNDSASTTSSAPAVDSYPLIESGKVVLAIEGKAEGWFEAVVQKREDNGFYSLKWRDFPDFPVFYRPYHDLAFIHPKHIG